MFHARAQKHSSPPCTWIATALHKRLCRTGSSAAAGQVRPHLSRRQGKQEGVPIRPVTAPEVEQALLLEAVVQALC